MASDLLAPTYWRNGRQPTARARARGDLARAREPSIKEAAQQRADDAWHGRESTGPQRARRNADKCGAAGARGSPLHAATTPIVAPIARREGAGTRSPAAPTRHSRNRRHTAAHAAVAAPHNSSSLDSKGARQRARAAEARRAALPASPKRVLA